MDKRILLFYEVNAHRLQPKFAIITVDSYQIITAVLNNKAVKGLDYREYDAKDILDEDDHVFVVCYTSRNLEGRFVWGCYASYEKCKDAIGNIENRVVDGAVWFRVPLYKGISDVNLGEF